MSRNNDYATGNLLYYQYHQKYYKDIGIDLSRQKNTSIPQQINFTGQLKEYGATMFSITGKQRKTILIFSLDSLIVTEAIVLKQKILIKMKQLILMQILLTIMKQKVTMTQMIPQMNIDIFSNQILLDLIDYLF